MDCDEENEEIDFGVEGGRGVGWEGWGVEGELVGLGKGEVGYGDVGMEGKGVSVWVVGGG